MKTQQDTTVIQSAYGSEQFKTDHPNGLKVSFDYEVLENFDEVIEKVSKGDLVDLVNARNKSNARSAAIASATSSYKPDPNSPEEVRKRMIGDLKKRKPELSDADAAALVDSLLS